MNRSPAFPPVLAAHLAAGARRLRRRYRKRLARSQKRFSEKSVHDLRVETRRMLAMLDLWRALNVGKDLKKLRKIFKERLDSFDELRDTQVQLMLLKPLNRTLPEAWELDPILRRQERKLIKSLSREIKGIKQPRVERKLKAIEKLLRDQAEAGSKTASLTPALRTLHKAFDDVMTLRRRVRRSDTDTIHSMRVAFKRFRYMSELLQPLFPHLTEESLQEMHTYQSLMGDIQDLEVLRERVTQAARKKDLPAATARTLQSELRRRHEKTINHFMAVIDGLDEFEPPRRIIASPQ